MCSISIVSCHVTQELTPIWDNGPSCLMNGVDGVDGIYPITLETKQGHVDTPKEDMFFAWIPHGSQVSFHVGFHVFIWVCVNTYRYIFSGMNIHLPAILGFTRYQGFDPSPFGG